MPASDFADVLSRILPFTEEDDQILLEPYNYLAQNSGKNVRSQLIEAFNFWLAVDPSELRIINKVVGMLHTSSLLMDDVEDSSVLRRGQPVAHLIYGVPQTINTANYVYFLAYQELLKLRPSLTAVRSATASTSGSSSSSTGSTGNGGRRSSRGEDGNTSSSSSSGSSGNGRLRTTNRPSARQQQQQQQQAVEAALKADKDRLITPPLSPRPGAGRVPTAGDAAVAAVTAADESETGTPAPTAKGPTIPLRLGAKLGLRWDDEPESSTAAAAAAAGSSSSSSSSSSSCSSSFSNDGRPSLPPALAHRTASSSSSTTVVNPTATSTSMDGTATPPLATSTTSVTASAAAALDAGGGRGPTEGSRKADNLDRIVTEEMLSLHRGQGLELFWRDSLTCPTEDEYVKMVLGKTGGLFRIAIKLMMAKSSCDVDLVPLVNLISIFFQIRDDYMNIQSSEYADNKNFAEDLTEGKFSFPIIHAIRANPASRIVINTLHQKPKDVVVLQHCVDFMRKETRSFAYTKAVLDTLGSAVRTELARVEGLMAAAVGGGGDGGANGMLEAIPV